MIRRRGEDGYGARMFGSFFSLQGSDRRRIEERLRVMTAVRLPPIILALLLLSIYFLIIDIRLLQLYGEKPSFSWYLVLDSGFFILHTVALLFIRLTHRCRRNRTVPAAGEGDNASAAAISWWFIRGYALLCLLWAGLMAAAEQADTGQITTLIIAVLAVSVLGFFRSTFLLLLFGVSVTAFIAGRFFLPDMPGWALPDLIPLASLVLLGFVVSRSFYSTAAEGLRATFRLQEAAVQVKRANRRLAEQNRSLQELKLSLIQQEKLATVGELAAGIVHEISNPLVFIKSNTSALREHIEELLRANGSADPAGLKRAEEIGRIFMDNEEGYRRIIALLDSLRYFSYNSVEHRFEQYDLNRGIESTLRIARGRIEKSARIELDLGSIPPIECDAGSINQVLMNIIMNAVQAIEKDATGNGSEKKTIDIRSFTNGARAVCEFRNDGPPIPQSVRDRIFEPFFSTRSIGTGMGLGLSLCREIVERRHGGRLQLLPEHPTTFRIELPVHQSVR